MKNGNSKIMKHIIIGGDGFVGARLAADLHERGHEVLVADINKSAHTHYSRVPFLHLDVTDRAAFEALPLEADDMVYNLSAKMLSPIQPRAKRQQFFWPVNYDGTANTLDFMESRGATRIVHFTTDMVYGHAIEVPVKEDHRVRPLGEYGESKLASEHLCHLYREKGFDISIFRPRLIIGPGRLGILSKLFKLIDNNLPVPMIGSGRNAYQFVSVFDCASAARLAFEAGVPNSEYNLGSDNPPPVRELLARLVREAGSKSILLPTPGWAVKRVLDLLDFVNLPLMDPEQYLIADEYCIVDTARARADIGWIPAHRDDDMLIAAYREYRNAGTGAQDGAPVHVPAE